MPCIAENRLVLVISAATIIYLFIWLWATHHDHHDHHHVHTYAPLASPSFVLITDLQYNSCMHLLGTLVPHFCGVNLASAWLVNKPATKTRYRFLSIAFTSAFGSCPQHQVIDCANQLVQGVRWRQLNVACSSLISAVETVGMIDWNGSMSAAFWRLSGPSPCCLQAGEKNIQERGNGG